MAADPLHNLRQQLTDAPITDPPTPWRCVVSIGVGGLTHVGYAENSDTLLILSHQGRGVIDCLTGERVARDDEEVFPGHDTPQLECPGIGPLEGQTIRIAGLTGGGLPSRTRDGWKLETLALPWPSYSIFLSPSCRSVLDGLRVTTKVADDGGVCEFRACGFSDTGNTFVVALSCAVSIFARRAETR